MRWPLSLLFRGDRDAAAAPGPGAAAPGGPRDGGAPGAANEPRPAAWSTLPAVQRTVGPIPLTAPALPFGRRLASRNAPAPILRPLAHDVAADGPAGLVSGIAAPLVRPASAQPAHPEAPALPAPGAHTPLQRRGHGISLAAEPGVGAGVSTSGGGPGVAHPPARSLPSVPPTAAAPALIATRVAPSPASELPRAVAPVAGPSAQRAALAEPGEVTGAAAPGGQSAEAAEAAVPAATAAPGETAAPADARPGTEGPDAAPDSPVQRRTLGASRRLGLGAPLASRPAPRPAPAGAPPMPLARGAHPATSASGPTGTEPAVARAATATTAPLPVLRLAGGGPDPAPAAEAPSGAGASSRPGAREAGVRPRGDDAGPDVGTPPAPGARPLVGDPVRRPSAPVADDEPAVDAPAEGELPLVARLAGPRPADADAAAGPEPPIGEDVPPARSEGPAGEPGAPAPAGIGSAAAPPAATPVRPAAPEAAPTTTVPLVVARSYRSTRDPLRPSVAPMPDAPVAVLARRAIATRAGGGDRPDAGSPGPGGRAAGTVAGSAGVDPGLAVAGVGPGRFAPRDAGHEPTSPTPSAPAPAVQRREGAAAAAPSSAPASPSWAALARPIPADGPGAGSPARGSRAAAMPLATPAAAEPGSPDTAAVPVSRLAAGAVPSIQPAAGWAPTTGFTAAGPTAGPAVQRAVDIGEVSAEVGGAGGAGEGGGQGGQDYEEIAERVYDRIRSRFATELLLDRERMGLLIDG